MALVTVTAATTAPVTISEVKDHLVVDHSDDDQYLAGLIDAVVEYLEAVQDRTLVTTTYDLKLDRFPDGNGTIELEEFLVYFTDAGEQADQGVAKIDPDELPQPLSNNEPANIPASAMRSILIRSINVASEKGVLSARNVNSEEGR